MPTVYARALFELSEADEDRFVADVAADSLGVREITRGAGRVLLELWATGPVAALEERLRASGFAPRETSEVEESDWMAGARARAEPIEVGEGFLLDPREPDGDAAPAAADGRISLRLPARRAFGTGTHETTQLMVRGLEALGDLHAARVLDVGAGTGVLSFAALCLGAGRAIGFDLDLPSAFVACENFELNRQVTERPPSMFAGSIDSVREAAEFDLVLVNVLPEHLRGSEAKIARTVAPGGRLLLAGLLETQREAVLPRWTSHGLEPASELRQGEWLLVELRRGPEGPTDCGPGGPTDCGPEGPTDCGPGGPT